MRTYLILLFICFIICHCYSQCGPNEESFGNLSMPVFSNKPIEADARNGMYYTIDESIDNKAIYCINSSIDIFITVYDGDEVVFSGTSDAGECSFGLVGLTEEKYTIHINSNIECGVEGEASVISISCLTCPQAPGSVGIGTEIPEASAVLDLVSASQGFLPPRLQSADDVTSPVEGLILYQLSQPSGLKIYRNEEWQSLVIDAQVDDVQNDISTINQNLAFRSQNGITKSIRNTDSFLFGANSINETSTSANDPNPKFVFLPDIGVFRAGHDFENVWQEDSLGLNSFAVGRSTLASGEYSFSSGLLNKAIGDYSLTMGRSNDAKGNYSMAFGLLSESIGDYSIALGASTQATSPYAISMGQSSRAMGTNALAIGASSRASGTASTAIGLLSEASGDYSFAIGSNSNAFGQNSMAMGGAVKAHGDFSMATGLATSALGNYSTAMGLDVYANDNYSLVIGKYNDTTEYENSLFVIGNGTSNSQRSNAFVIDKDGNGHLDGHMEVNWDGLSDNRVSFQVGIPSGEVSNIGRIYSRSDDGASNPSKALTSGYSIYASGPLAAPEYLAFSDKRIKKIKGVSNSKEDLEIVRKIKVKDYSLKDTIRQGIVLQKKIIAQELKKVFPQAVSSNTTRVVPDIYQNASIDKNGFIELESFEEVVRVGDQVQLIFLNGVDFFRVDKVTNQGFHVMINGSHSSLSVLRGDESNVFVYGRLVDDFHVVDYEAINMLHLSATQELIRKIEILETENEALKECMLRVNKQDERLDSVYKQLEVLTDSLFNTDTTSR